MNKLLPLIIALLPAPVFAKGENVQKIAVEVTEKGFVPSSIDVKPGSNVTLVVTRKTENTCATNIQVPSKKIKTTPLPLNQPVEVALGELISGEIKFGCGMNMMDSGKIVVLMPSGGL
jgi:plastocyanin domain-containing protein